MEDLKKIFEVGKQYTIYRISECMAMTGKTELTVKEVQDSKIVFTIGKGRKRFVLPFESRSYQSAPMIPFKGAIFDGWDQPVKCDSETGGLMRGNACYNFEGTVDAVRDWIDAGQLNPFFERYKVVAIGQAKTEFAHGSETVVFPKEYKGGHAIIDRLLAEAVA